MLRPELSRSVTKRTRQYLRVTRSQRLRIATRTIGRIKWMKNRLELKKINARHLLRRKMRILVGLPRIKSRCSWNLSSENDGNLKKSRRTRRKSSTMSRIRSRWCTSCLPPKRQARQATRTRELTGFKIAQIATWPATRRRTFQIICRLRITSYSRKDTVFRQRHWLLCRLAPVTKF